MSVMPVETEDTPSHLCDLRFRSVTNLKLISITLISTLDKLRSTEMEAFVVGPQDGPSNAQIYNRNVNFLFQQNLKNCFKVMWQL